jgi:hypothetical protein
LATEEEKSSLGVSGQSTHFAVIRGKGVPRRSLAAEFFCEWVRAPQPRNENEKRKIKKTLQQK